VKQEDRISKKSERQKAKKEIKFEIERLYPTLSELDEIEKYRKDYNKLISR